MLTDTDVAALNDQACENNFGRQGEWDELNEDGKAWARELARLAYERGRGERVELWDEGYAAGYADGNANAEPELSPVECTVNPYKKPEPRPGATTIMFDGSEVMGTPVRAAPRPYECTKTNPCGSCAVCWE